jgi:hypothetical protein
MKCVERALADIAYIAPALSRTSQPFYLSIQPSSDTFARLISHDVSEERDDSAEVWRAAVLPSTWPVLVLKTACKESLPWW